MLTKLLPLTDFVNNIDEYLPRELTQEFIIWERNQLTAIKRYSKFLSQKLTLGMFVPVNENGNVLEEPKQYIGALELAIGKDYDDALLYKDAKSKVLFEGFNVVKSRDSDDEYDIYEVANIFCKHYSPWRIVNGFKNIEDLVIGKYHPFRPNPGYTLTETAIKQIYG